MEPYIDILFTALPGPGDECVFVETENEEGQSIKTGEWVTDQDQFARLRIKVKPGLNGLAAKIHDTAVASGFWEQDRNMGEMLMLMTSELAEALEEHRDGKPNFYVNDTHGVFECHPKEWLQSGMVPNPGKPEGVAVELADCLIRILDTMGSLGVDIDAVVAAKMSYNATRPYKHGKAY